MEHNFDELPSTSRRNHGLLRLGGGSAEMRYAASSLPIIVDGGFKNLTTRETRSIPEEVQILLSWGPKFLPPHVSTLLDYVDTMYFVFKVLMKNISMVYPEMCFRQLMIDQYSVLQKFNAMKPTLSHTERMLQRLFQVTKHFLMQNSEYCIVQAYKGHITTLMNRSVYRMKMDEIVSYYLDTGIYRLFEGDFSTERKAIFNSYQDIVRKLNEVYNFVVAKGGSVFPSKFYEMLGDYMREDLPLPYMHGIVQCHKEAAPLRPIWKIFNWYSHPIQKIVSFVLSKFIAKYLCPQNVNDITAVVRELYTIPLCEGYEFVKCHIVDIYNQIDENKIIEIVERLTTGAEYEGLIDKIPSSLLLQCLQFTIQKASYFSYNNKVYKQNCGLPHGACDSALLLTLLLDYQIQLKYMTLFEGHRIAYWWKNKDDVLVYIPAERVESFRKSLEKIIRLQLIVEREERNDEGLTQINFLDLTIVRGYSDLEVSLNRDLKASFRMLHYLSNHLITFKRHALRELIQQVLERTHNRRLENDLTFCELKFYNNSYPAFFIADAFSQSVSKEIEAITSGRPSLPMSKQKLDERISILKNFMKRLIS